METWNTSSLLRAVPRVLFATDNVLILTQSCSLLPSTSSDDFFVRTFKSPRWWVCSCSLCLISANSLSCWRNARLACPQAQWCNKSVVFLGSKIKHGNYNYSMGVIQLVSAFQDTLHSEELGMWVSLLLTFQAQAKGMETNPTFPRNNSGLKRKSPRSEHPPIGDSNGRAQRIRQFH